jgi:uncharacterized membrane protein (DUF106 family)
METGVILFLAAQLIAGVLGFVKIYTLFSVQIAQLFKDYEQEKEKIKILAEQQKETEKKLSDLDNKLLRKLDEISSQIQRVAVELQNKQNRPL